MRERLRRRIRWWEALLVMIVGLTAGNLIDGEFNGQTIFATLVTAAIAAPFPYLVDRWVQRREERKRAPLISPDPDDYR